MHSSARRGHSYIECDELEILIGLGDGEFILMSEFLNGELRNRWISSGARSNT
jgi:hypothetical protein